MSAAAQATPRTLSEGDHAPEIGIPADDGSQISLADYAGKHNLVLYFYPKDDTPGCTTEAKDFRDHLDAFKAAGTAIVGISKDSIEKHCKFIAKHDLNFRLASDENGDMCERYGVWVEKNMYGKTYMGIQRATFLINKHGTIARIWPKVKVDGHVEQVLEASKAL